MRWNDLYPRRGLRSEPLGVLGHGSGIALALQRMLETTRKLLSVLAEAPVRGPDAGYLGGGFSIVKASGRIPC